ncbi:WD40-repeat-containing domain protein [Phyllosticta capitalensis]
MASFGHAISHAASTTEQLPSPQSSDSSLSLVADSSPLLHRLTHQPSHSAMLLASQDTPYHADIDDDLPMAPQDDDSDMDDAEPPAAWFPQTHAHLASGGAPLFAPPAAPSGPSQAAVDDLNNTADDASWPSTTSAAMFPGASNEAIMSSLGNAYFSIPQFVEHWRVLSQLKEYRSLPKVGPEAMRMRYSQRPKSVTREELRDNTHDLQGINWEKLETTREQARSARSSLYYLTGQSLLPPSTARLPGTERYVDFRRTNTNHHALIAHFQLRNLISATSRQDIYYAGRSRIMRTDSLGQSTSCVMDLARTPFSPLHSATFDITSMATSAADNLLIAGAFHGEFALTSLSAAHGTKPTQGFITHHPNGITNHVHIFPSRSGSAPTAAFSSNDRCMRLLDCTTATLTATHKYQEAINCSATAPDARLRAVVGDFHEGLITDADSGAVLQRLPRVHNDHAFACAWADDGVHVATGAQDSTVAIWDARNWAQPLTSFYSTLACPRSLHFSPVGGGRRVLLAAEADDVVNVVDAVSFDKCQSIDFFGAVAGVSWVPDGSSFFVANADAKFGGIMEFERSAWGEAEEQQFAVVDGSSMAPVEHVSHVAPMQGQSGSGSSVGRVGLGLISDQKLCNATSTQSTWSTFIINTFIKHDAHDTQTTSRNTKNEITKQWRHKVFDFSPHSERERAKHQHEGSKQQ